MTKTQMIETIQAKEMELWLELAKYDYRNAPRTGNEQDERIYTDFDIGHKRKLSKWIAVSELLEELGIEALHNEPALKLFGKLSIEQLNARENMEVK